MTTSDRALASGLFMLFAILIVSALLFVLFDPAVEQVVESSSQQAVHSSAQDAIDTRETIWDNILLYPLFVGAIAIIAKSVREAKKP